MNQTLESTQDELARRHRAAAMMVGMMLALTLVLVAIAFLTSIEKIRRADLAGDPTLPMALWITILVFGLGAFMLRRTRFAAMRLQDIAALRGISGLLQTLQGTTVQVAFLGGGIALLGFIVTILTGNKFDMLRAGGVALVVLLYCYPQRAAWQRLVLGIERKGTAGATSAKGNIT